MKHFLIIIFLCFQSALLAQDHVEHRLKQLEEFKVEKWLTFSMGSWSAHGDYFVETDILIQKLPDNRFLLSVRGPGDNLHVAKSYLSKPEADELKEKAIKFLETAIPERSLEQKIRENYKGEERQKAYADAFPLGPTGMAIILKITVPNSATNLSQIFGNEKKDVALFNYGRTKRIGANFDEEKSTGDAYFKFLEELRELDPMTTEGYKEKPRSRIGSP